MDITLTPWEDHLLERKTERDLKTIRQAATAFANSVRPGHIAAILIGECNDGSVPGVTDADGLQRKIRTELERIYPPIEWRQIVYKKEGRSCIRIEIEYDANTPHFGDAAWIRQGAETIKAPEAMLQKLVELRLSKVRALSEWVGKEVTASWSNSTPPHRPNWMKYSCVIVNVTNFFVTFQGLQSENRRSEPISWLDISWDDDNNRLRIFVSPEMATVTRSPF
jgi:hypothetical protein